VKVVFLDFDGPIIPLQSHAHRIGLLEKAWPPCVAALNRITDSTGAMIVVSSSWRCAGQAVVTAQLKMWGVTADVIGITPEFASRMESGIWVTFARGREVAAYLEAHPEIESFVIFDDDEDMEELSHRLIRTPFEVGITETDADAAIAMLSAPQQQD
jgi:hypothetical protein